MLPSHKARVIAEVQTLLDPKNPQLIGVVCTQVLEAGVDLSFRSLLRALPVFPSVIQAAGRANRHGGSSAPAEVVVFDYRREDGRPSREYIYKSGNARRHTDDLLKQRCPLSERDVPEALDEYFRRLWSSEPSTACLQRFEKAAKGAWSELAGLEPFDGDDGWRVDVFVPIANPEDYLNPALDGLMKRFAPGGTR
jgi:CRISPR/Cas system-associated endonuclease/helicase Cas3